MANNMERGPDSLAQNEHIKDKQAMLSDAVSSTIPVHSDQASAISTDETSRLRELQADVRDQDDLERDISRQVSVTMPLWILVC